MESEKELSFVDRAIATITAAMDKTIAEFRSYKAGARHSTSDRTDIQTVHDIAVKQPTGALTAGAECLTVEKDAHGKLRWTIISTSAYEDRDDETVSQKAHAADIAHMDKTGDYGVLRWWHDGLPEPGIPGDYQSYKAGPGLDLGVCDFSEMRGRVRIETGTFYDEGIGAKIKEAADKLSVSLGFSHPVSEPDASGVFENIHTFERSFLPKGKQSNRIADVLAIAKEKAMDNKEKEAAFRVLVGDDLAEKVLAQADSAQKEADAQGLKFKELEPDAEAAAEALAPEAAPDEERKVGDLSMAELKAYIGECMAAYDAAKTTKEAGELAEFKETSTKTVNDVIEIVNKHGRRLKTLEGDAPVSVSRKLRASEAEETVTEKAVTGPKPDPTHDVLDAMLGIPQAAAAVNGTPPPAIK